MATAASSSSTRERIADSSDWIERLARLGYIAKGVVYGAVGVLSLMAALGAGGAGEKAGSEDALRTIGEQPFGRVLLGLIAVGLVGYIVWRFVQAIKDPDDKGCDALGIAKRVGFGISGLTYAVLAFVAGRLAVGASGGGSSSSSGSKEELTARVMSEPFGQWAVGLAGVVVIGVGLHHFARSYKASFMKKYKTHEMSEKETRSALHVGRFGLAARGVTFCMIGVFIVQAAMRSNPDEAAKGLGGALSALAAAPYGPWLLGVVAAGFVAYAVYCFSRARYRVFNA